MATRASTRSLPAAKAAAATAVTDSIAAGPNAPSALTMKINAGTPPPIPIAAVRAAVGVFPGGAIDTVVPALAARVPAGTLQVCTVAGAVDTGACMLAAVDADSSPAAPAALPATPSMAVVVALATTGTLAFAAAAASWTIGAIAALAGVTPAMAVAVKATLVTSGAVLTAGLVLVTLAAVMASPNISPATVAPVASPAVGRTAAAIIATDCMAVVAKLVPLAFTAVTETPIALAIKHPCKPVASLVMAPTLAVVVVQVVPVCRAMVAAVVAVTVIVVLVAAVVAVAFAVVVVLISTSVTAAAIIASVHAILPVFLEILVVAGHATIATVCAVDLPVIPALAAAFVAAVASAVAKSMILAAKVRIPSVLLVGTLNTVTVPVLAPSTMGMQIVAVLLTITDLRMLAPVAITGPKGPAAVSAIPRFPSLRCDRLLPSHGEFMRCSIEELCE